MPALGMRRAALTVGPGALATAIVFAHRVSDAGELLTLVRVVPVV